MGSLDGKVAFITGVARGQGRSHAVRLAADGAAIIGVDICADIGSNGYPMATREELDETVALVEAQGGKMVGSVADVRDFHQIKAALDAGVEQFGRLDIVLANAGIATMAFRELTDEEDLEHVDRCPQCESRWCISHREGRDTAPHRRRAGWFDRLHQLHRGLRGFGGLQGGGLGYAASKHGIVGLMRTLANALAPHSIRVNTVHPTAVNTMMAVNPAMLSFLEHYPDGGPHLQNPMPVALLEPEDISAAIAYLVSDEGKYVTGVTFPVDAGFCNKL